MKITTKTYLRVLAVPLACVAFSLGSKVAAQRSHQPAGRGAFLGFQVESTRELVGVLKTHPTLRKQFARHFGVSEPEAVDFVNRALIPYRLPRAQTITNYGVTKSGRIFSTQSRLPKGTRVWATRSGVAILKWQCSNPLTKVMPGTKMASAPRVSRKKRAPKGKMASSKWKSPLSPEALPEALLAAAPIAGGAGGGAPVPLTGLGSATLAAASPTTLVAGNVQQLGSGGLGLRGLAPFLFIPALFGRGGGSSNDSPPSTVTPPKETVPPTETVLPPTSPFSPTPALPDGTIPMPPVGTTPPPDILLPPPSGFVPPTGGTLPPGEVTPPEGGLPPVVGQPSPEVIPEPGTVVLLAAGVPMVWMAAVWRRRKGTPTE